VNGTARVTGVGATNATTAFTVRNSSGTNIFTAQDESGISLNSFTDSAGINFQNANSTRFQIRQGNATLNFSGTATSNGGFNFTNNVLNSDGRNKASLVSINAPTISFSSGTNNYRGINLDYTVHTSGGTNTVVGLRINPTLNSLTGTTHYAIQTTMGGVLINSTSPNATAVLQADSTTQGFLPPRMTTTEKNAIATPATGLQIYDNVLNRPCFYDGATWITL
jgi:hypothetical protein